jgi:predicted  nucleic acid-binding Zn-ribbon protein
MSTTTTAASVRPISHAVDQPAKVIPKLDEVSLRNELSRCIVDRDRALGRRDRAQAAVVRCKAFVADLQAKVEALLEHDQEAVSTTAAAFKKQLAKDLTPKLTPADELSTSAMQRLHSEAHLMAGREALTALEQDLAEAEMQLTTAEAKTKLAAKNIVAAHANRLAEKLLHAETEAALLRRRLLGVTQTRGPHLGQFPVDAFTMSVARGDAVPRYSHAEPVDVAYFDSYQARLTMCADAQPEEA